METLTCIIVDDEAAARETLASILENYFPEVRILSMPSDGVTALEAMREHQPDLVFLDIEMPGISGLDVARLAPKGDFSLVFTTAHRDYALRAIKLSALDYLLKPLGVEELREVITRVREQQNVAQLHERLQLIEGRLSGQVNRTGRIALPSMEGFEVLEIEQIVRCESESNYTRFYVEGQAPLLVTRTLAAYEKLLLDAGFIRIHQSHLIQLAQVRRYLKGRGGNVEMR
ncbi:MAG: LytTR family DNA-binding domain-containing protein, partial [Bacteroidota bacterium]